MRAVLEMTEPMHRDELPVLFDHLGFRTGAEIGVYKGQFSERILEGSQVTKLYSVDAWVDVEGNPMSSVIKECENRLKRFGDRSEMVMASSVQAASTFPDWVFDFVYIDADHRYEAVKADIAAWFPKVKPGGILAGHDYSRKGRSLVPEMVTAAHPQRYRKEVVPAVDEFVAAHGFKLGLTRDRPHSWWVVVSH